MLEKASDYDEKEDFETSFMLHMRILYFFLRKLPNHQDFHIPNKKKDHIKSQMSKCAEGAENLKMYLKAMYQDEESHNTDFGINDVAASIDNISFEEPTLSNNNTVSDDNASSDDNCKNYCEIISYFLETYC